MQTIMARTAPLSTGQQSVWIDLCDPTEDERRAVEDAHGVTIPTLAALSEIENSSRLQMRDGALMMTAPLLTHSSEDRWRIAPTGFIVTAHTLITVHYAPLVAFDAAAHALGERPETSAAAMLVRVLEEVVDRAADHLEHVSELISSVSTTVFYTDIERKGLSRETALLRRAIIRLGRAYDKASRVRYMFLNVGRLASFAAERWKGEIDAQLAIRVQSVVRDIASLDEYETSLSARIQFLQDAATSLVNIEQNDVTKVLTVASVVGIPPVLVVGIYGMNFHAMPELSWPWGYPFALALCVVTTLVPYLWFKWRKWV